MIMIEAGIPYTEKNFNKATWPSHKVAGIKSGLYTYGQGLFLDSVKLSIQLAIETDRKPSIVQFPPVTFMVWMNDLEVPLPNRMSYKKGIRCYFVCTSDTHVCH